MNNQIIVIGTDHHNTLGIIRSLGEEGKSPIVMLPNLKSAFITDSKYLSKVIWFDKPNDIIDLLLRNYVDELNKVIVICSEDTSISVIDSHYDLLKDFFLLPNAKKQGRINHFLNKDNMHELAMEVGLTVPKTWYLKNGDALPTNIDFPCISKPCSSVVGGKNEICVNRNIWELKANTASDKDFIAQIFIEKDYELNMVALAYNHGNDFIIPGVIRKIREYPVNSGSSSFSVLDDCKKFPEIEVEKIKNFVREIGYEGLFSVEFVVKDGVAYFLEINMRNDGNGYVPTSMGINLHYLWCKYLVGEPIAQPSNINTPYYFMADTRDWVHVIKGRVSIKRWLEDRKKTRCYLLYNEKDKKPFFTFIKRKIFKY
ncbi:ATP-grasp domain-containing protein [Bacteroides cellulosilyticus]|jgi:D-aspartate ligase|uniref:ATP-grasp domain-containing protein n=1 Tax=Bacteroides cellulosilyticus TaxID=246787 RepID=UPI0018ACE20B|nr:ATP-grasp domain-containing protein [Bacteroides cellulosilyticus]